MHISHLDEPDRVIPNSQHVSRREIVLKLASELCLEERVTLSDLHCADEVFTTATISEV